MKNIHILPTDGTIIQFLNGSHSYEGVWFGERHPNRQGNFWWRSILNEWQAERMHSEEEVLDILLKFDNFKEVYHAKGKAILDYKTRMKLFEQFKKK
jgi:hypothetical protein